MRIVKWKPDEVAQGVMVDQVTACILGGLLTTLPALVVMPLMAGAFSFNWKLEREDGSHAAPEAGLISFFVGVGIWCGLLLAF